MESLEEALADIEIQKAKMILNEAKSGGFMDGDIPETPEKIVEEAQYWYSEAFKARDAGMKHDTVFAILAIMEGEPGGGSDYNEGYASMARTQPVQNAEKVAGDEAPDVIVPKTSAGPTGPAPAMEQQPTPDPVKQYNLPVPKDWEGDPEDFPRDISELTDKDVRRLSGEYNAYLSRAKWLLALAINDLANATHLRDHAYRVALKKTPKKDGEKAKLKEVLDSEVREDPTFASYDTAVLKHQSDVTILKSLVDIYSGNVDRLSREWTMRQDEYEKTR